MIDDSVFRKLENFFLFKEVIIKKPVEISEFVITDYGTQWISPGGNKGLYHRFEFNYENKNHTLWISPRPWRYTCPHPHCLISCLDISAYRALQLDLDNDKYAVFKKNHLEIIHDGKMTRRGGITNKQVVDAVEEKFTGLITSDRRINLGKIIMDKNDIEFNNISDFLIRVFKYCLVREELRNI